MSDFFSTAWTVAYQAPLSMGFFRQQCWSDLPFPSLGDLPDPGIKPSSPVLQVDSLPLSRQGSPHYRTVANLKFSVNYRASGIQSHPKLSHSGYPCGTSPLFWGLSLMPVQAPRASEIWGSNWGSHCKRVLGDRLDQAHTCASA